MPTATPARPSAFRPDLEGLRAIAVVLVVLFHAGVRPLSGGYVGVDVFFVLSGYLITGLLARELEGSGGIDLRSFYARRARRILPASILVLAVTLVASAVILAPVRLGPVAGDVAAAAVYIPNIRFAMEATDYWNPGAVSPVLHFWSLGVEEQFYLLWPTFLVLVWRLGSGSTRGLLRWVAASTAASFVLGLALTPLEPTAAFYLLPTRAWELGAGAVLVLAERHLPPLQPRLASAAGTAGLALIAFAAFAFDARTPFPGIAAVVPVAGAVLVVLAGRGATGSWFAPLLASRPMQFLGRTSYSIYLWHWPLIVLGAAAAGRDESALATGLRVAVEVAATVVLAALTYRWIEDPLRRGRIVGTRPGRNLGLALAASVTLAVVAVTAGTVAMTRFAPPVVASAVEEDVDPLATDLLAGMAGGAPSPGTGSPGAGSPAGTDAPAGSAAQGGTSSPAPSPSAATGPVPLPADLLPSLAKPVARGPAATPRQSHCGLNDPEVVPPRCVDGLRTSDTTVVLFGDSHAMHWFPALERVADDRGWRLVTLVKASCPYMDVPVMLGDLTRPFTECATWRENAFERIAEERPSLVVVSGNHLRTPVDATGDVDQDRRTLLAGATRTIGRLQAIGADVVVLGDTPTLPFDPVDCLSRHPDDTTRCAIARSELFDTAWLEGERAVAEAAGASFVDTSAWLCPTDTCPLVMGRYLVYRDSNHISLPLSWALAGRLDAALPRE